MIDQITLSHIYNQVRMTRSYHHGVIIIFESDNDIRNFKKFFNEERCEYIPSFGKKNALKTIKNVEKDNINGVLAILDNDYWLIGKSKTFSPNILTTDTHDSETMIIKSKAFDNFLLEFTDESSLKQLVQNEGKSVREILLENVKFIGYFRFFLSTYKIRAFFLRHLKFQRIVDRNSLDVDVNLMIWESLKRNLKKICCLTNFETFKDYIIQVLKDIDKENFDLWHICSGHDIIKLLVIGLRFVFGNKEGKGLSESQLEKILRISYTLNYFESTNLYNSIKQWESNNANFKIF